MEQGWLLHMPICSDKFEWSFLVQEPILPLVWKRYIDDILCIWTGARSELDKFNKAHKTPRFTWSISDKHIEFLFKMESFNTTIHLDMTTHFKTYNTFQYLHFSSGVSSKVLLKMKILDSYFLTHMHILQCNKYIQRSPTS